MIGHALLMFSPEEEDRILTGKLHGHMVAYREPGQKGCLFQVATDCERPIRFNIWSRDIEHTIAGEDRLFPQGRFSQAGARWVHRHGSVAHRYDALCSRFGVKRIGNAIRGRILTNQLRRQLASQAVSV